MNAQPNTNPATDPRDEEMNALAAFRAAGWFSRAHMVERWPLLTSEAVTLLREGGCYAATVEGIEDLIERRLLPRPAIDEDGGFSWSACDLVNAAGLLEMRREWLFDSSHDAKRTKWAMMAEAMRREGQIALPADAPVFDVRHLLAMLANAERAEDREKTVELLALTLQREHGIKV